MTYTDELRTRWLLGQECKPDYAVTSLPLVAIKLATDVFQFRLGKYSGIYSERHIDTLVRSLKSNAKAFDPLTVFFIDGEYYVLDGHHRLEAYKRCEYEQPEIVADIPVVEFLGSFDEALCIACESNAQDKLNMALPEKQNAAWRLVCQLERNRGYAKAIRVASGVDKNTVTKYTKLHAALLEEGEDPADYTVQEAMSRKREQPEYNEEWEDIQAAALIPRLRQGGGPLMNSHPEIAAKALHGVLTESSGKAVVHYLGYIYGLDVIDPEIGELDF